MLAVATSAIREATNGEDFLERVGRELGIYPRAVSGDEEARLIYLAALHSIHLEGRRALVVDIGGGSVELALGSGPPSPTRRPRRSGCCACPERFVHGDPLSGAGRGGCSRPQCGATIAPPRRAAGGLRHA